MVEEPRVVCAKPEADEAEEDQSIGDSYWANRWLNNLDEAEEDQNVGGSYWANRWLNNLDEPDEDQNVGDSYWDETNDEEVGSWSPPSFCGELCKHHKNKQSCLSNCRQRDEMNDEEVGTGPPPRIHWRPQRYGREECVNRCSGQVSLFGREGCVRLCM